MRDQEKPYWHPHNFEWLSGQPVAPGLPETAEKAFFERLVNFYGKTWHTNSRGGQPGMDPPYGDPKPMWSFLIPGVTDVHTAGPEAER
ncbi:DUF1264 domain-containing protein [Streptomyces sp. NTH33]|uniref:DUF1264 domain-containing protein n=1 Tax=Streptomyces sp. NTH33 TaxID=1735453 RepID=UPI001C64AA45|nr:DUF1264 domain-containing protein [Streptomyces sp. NTH33]